MTGHSVHLKTFIQKEFHLQSVVYEHRIHIEYIECSIVHDFFNAFTKKNKNINITVMKKLMLNV